MGDSTRNACRLCSPSKQKSLSCLSSKRVKSMILICIAFLEVFTHSGFESCNFWISDCASSGHLPYTIQAHLWVEKLDYHALCHNFTRFPLNYKGEIFTSKMKVQKHTSAAVAYKVRSVTEKMENSCHPCTSVPEKSHLFFPLSTDKGGEQLFLSHSQLVPEQACTSWQWIWFITSPPTPPCLCLTSFHTNPRKF